MVPNNMIFSDATVIFSSSDLGFFGNLTSIFHNLWVEKYATSRAGSWYTPTDCFETFVDCWCASIGSVRPEAPVRSQIMREQELNLPL